MKVFQISLYSMLLVLATQICRAQDSTVQVNYKKDKPVQILLFENTYDAKFAGWWEKKLDKKSGFTDNESKIIIARIGAGGGAPKDFSTIKYKKNVLAHYKAYQQYYFSRMGYEYSIVWLPYEENQHMPEGLRPTKKEGSVFLLNGKHITADGKDDKGSYIPMAGTPVSDKDMEVYASSTNTNTTSGQSGVTASGVQYSSADMSAFGPALLGCMAIYPSNGSSYMYLVPVRGASLGDKAIVADAAYKITGLADSRYRYEWFGGSSAETIKQKYKNSMSVSIYSTYTIK